MPSPPRGVEQAALPDPSLFNDMLRHLGATYQSVYEDREALRSQLRNLGSDKVWARNEKNKNGQHDVNAPKKVHSVWADDPKDTEIVSTEATDPVQMPQNGTSNDQTLAQDDEGNLGSKDVDDLSATVRKSETTEGAPKSVFQRLVQWCRGAQNNPRRERRLLKDQYHRLKFAGCEELKIYDLITALRAHYHVNFKHDPTQALARFVTDYCATARTRPSIAEKLLIRKSSIKAPESIEPPQSSCEDLGDTGIPLASFCRLATMEDFQDMQMLQDDVPILLEIRKALHEERKVAAEVDANFKTDNQTNLFESLAAVVIIANAITMGVHADLKDDAESSRRMIYIEMGFVAFFLVEMIVKFIHGGLNCVHFFCGNQWYWNMLDAVIVTLGMTEIILSSMEKKGDWWGASLISLIRLFRLVRLLRFKVLGELRQMVAGVFAGLRVLFWAVVLLVFFVFVVALITRNIIGASGRDLPKQLQTDAFGNMMWSMFTVFRCVTDGCSAYDGTPLQVYMLESLGPIFMLTYVLVYLFVTVGIFNLIMAIFIDNVMESSVRKRQYERENSAAQMEIRLKQLICELSRSDRQHKKKTNMLTHLRDAWLWFDRRFRGHKRSHARKRAILDRHCGQLEATLTITKEVWNTWIQDQDLIDLLQDMDVHTGNKDCLFDVLDSDLSGQLEVNEVVSGLMTLRGPPEKCDTVATLLTVRHIAGMIEDIHKRLCKAESRWSHAVVGLDSARDFITNGRNSLT